MREGDIEKDMLGGEGEGRRWEREGHSASADERFPVCREIRGATNQKRVKPNQTGQLCARKSILVQDSQLGGQFKQRDLDGGITRHWPRHSLAHPTSNTATGSARQH